MATYYVRKSGNDGNDGLTPATAWLTVSKALGTTGISSGDTVYVGAGVYREDVTVTMTSATTETFIIADTDGSHTGDIGEVILTTYENGDLGLPSAVRPLSSNSRDFLTVIGFVFVGGIASPQTVFINSASKNWKLIKCIMVGVNGLVNNLANIDALVGNGNHVVDSCIFYSLGAGAPLRMSLALDTTNDWDTNIVITNCIFLNGGPGIFISSTSTGSGKPGGVRVYNCTFINGTRALLTNDANLSTTYPCRLYNSIVLYASTAAVAANTAGQIIEDYNFFWAATGRVNVDIGRHTIAAGTSAVSQYAPLLHFGQEILRKLKSRPLLAPTENSPFLGFGNLPNSTDHDNAGNPRPGGTILFSTTGTATSATATTLSDTTQNWPHSGFVGNTIKITNGLGSGHFKSINYNTGNSLTVDGNWVTTPDSASEYIVYKGALATMGKPTSATSTEITDSNARWGANMWLGYNFAITSGLGAGQLSLVSGNTSTVITVTGALDTTPDTTSVYEMYKGSGLDYTSPSIGAYERYNTAVKETGFVNTGTSSLKIVGPGIQEFLIPVDTTQTSVKVWGRYTNQYSGIKPQLIVHKGEGIGVDAVTGTMTVGGNTWEQISVTFTATSKGVITAQLRSNSVSPAGITFFDDFAIV